MKLNNDQYAIDLFQKIIQIDTTNELGNELEAVLFLQKILQEENISSNLIYSPKGRANLIAKLEGNPSGSSEENLVLLSHLDVVAANSEGWICPPFSGSIYKEKIWGRGTLDTKQLTIMHLVAFLSLSKCKSQLNRDVYLIASADEENGSAEGMEFLAQRFPEIFQGATVLSEGGGFTLKSDEHQSHMLFASGEKGTARIKIQTTGVGGHAGSPPVDQAILKLSTIIQDLIDLNFSTEDYMVLQVFNEATSRFTFQNLEAQKDLASRLVDYMKSPTLMVENIDIGETLNVIPYKAEAVLEFRTLPHQSKEQFITFMNQILEKYDAAWELLFFQKGYESQFDSTILQLFQQKAGNLGFSGSWLPFTALGKTDGRFISELASNIYGISPVFTLFTEVLKRVHNKNECLEVDSFLFGVNLMKSVLEDYCISNGGG